MKTIKKGSRGSEVCTLQSKLNLIVDGVFGSITEEAVKTFQRENGLKADGIVGDKTWNKLLFQTPSKRKITEIIVHCTGTPEGVNKTVEQIRQEHIRENGWADIGYQWLIYLDGSIHAGRSEDKIGAHCKGHNSYSIGVCYVGGLENKPNTPYKKLKIKDTRTSAQKLALTTILRQLKARYPQAKIYGHKDFDKTRACPSFDAKNEYKNI